MTPPRETSPSDRFAVPRPALSVPAHDDPARSQLSEWGTEALQLLMDELAPPLAPGSASDEPPSVQP